MSLRDELDKALEGDASKEVGRQSIAVTADDSLRAPIDTKDARNEFRPEWRPFPLSEISAQQAVSWAWYGFMAFGHVTLFTGLWKAGKTTLLAYLLRDFATGGDLAGSVKASRVLIVSEESQALWARRRDEIGIGDHVHLICKPFKARPRLVEWIDFVRHLAGLVESGGYRVVVFDTLASHWPVFDENDASGVIAALTPLNALTETGAAVMLVHHPRKGDAGEGQAARGSGALTGFVDVILELRRFNGKDADDRRRTLTGYSRFDETPRESVIELGEDGYRLIGKKANAERADRQSVIGEILTTEGAGLTVDEIREKWPEGRIAKPGQRTLPGDLRAGVDVGLWSCTGGGKKGDPYRYVATRRTEAE